MEYLELITKIIEAEHAARKMTEDAKLKLDTIGKALEKEQADLRESYFERARHRVETIRERENEAADEAVTRLKKKLEDELNEIDRTFSLMRSVWTDKIFSMIIGD